MMYTMYMALHINNPAVEKDVRSLAHERGQTITEVIGAAIKELKRSSHRAAKPKPTPEEIMALVRSFPSAPVNYDLTEDEILGYGPNGYCE